MSGSTSHTQKDKRVIERLDDPEYGLPQARFDRGKLEHMQLHRPRPYPYDTGTTLPVTAAAGADNFGNYTQLIPQGTYDFGDSPNRVQITAVVIEDISGNDPYILEFYKYDGATYAPIGAIRFARVSPFTRSFPIRVPCRPFNNDANALYARLKSATGGNNVTISLNATRYIPPSYRIPPSTGTWPTG